MPSSLTCGVVALFALLLVAASPVTAAPDSDVECSICKVLVSFLEAKNLTQDESELINEMYSLCDDLGKDLGSMCNETVNTYAVTIIHALQSGMAPPTVCSEIGLCPPSLAVRLEAEGGIPCEICELLVQVSEDFNFTKPETELLDELYRVCGDLGHTLSGPCNATVDKYGLPIIEGLKEGESPELICTQVQLCTGGVYTTTGGLTTSPPHLGGRPSPRPHHDRPDGGRPIGSPSRSRHQQRGGGGGGGAFGPTPRK